MNRTPLPIGTKLRKTFPPPSLGGVSRGHGRRRRRVHGSARPRAGAGRPAAGQRAAEHRRRRRRRHGPQQPEAVPGENIVALCDVDQEYAAKTFQEYPQAKVYRDFREMLDKQKDIDAVIVATPDHTHAVIAPGRDQGGQARLRPEADGPLGVRGPRADRSGPQAQGGHADGQPGPFGRRHPPDLRVDLERRDRRGPRGARLDQPPGLAAGDRSRAAKDTPPVPATLDWDLWLGPAPSRPYHPAYLPQSWRAWWDFGTGSLGDLGCHILDPVFWAMKLKYPVSVEACISTYWGGFWQKTEPKNEMYPRSTIVRYKFPARGDMPAVKLTWWDGGLMPPRPEELEEGRQMGDSDGGVLFIGDKGTLMCGCYGSSPRLIPEAKMKEFQPPPETIERIPGGMDGHEQDWIRACKGGPPASSQLRLFRPAVRDGADGQSGRAFPRPATAVGRREDGSHQRRGGQRLRPAGVSARVDAETPAGTVIPVLNPTKDKP